MPTFTLTNDAFAEIISFSPNDQTLQVTSGRALISLGARNGTAAIDSTAGDGKVISVPSGMSAYVKPYSPGQVTITPAVITTTVGSVQSKPSGYQLFDAAAAAKGITPLPYKIEPAGDSIPAASYDTATANAIKLRNYGHMSWLRFLTRQRILFNSWSGAAVPGMTAGGLAGTDTLQPNAAAAAAGYTALLASDVGWIDLTIGTNDVVATATAYAKFVTDYGLLVDRAIAAGKRIMLTPILPRSASMDAAKRRLAGRFNDYIFSRHDPARGVYVTDPTPAWLDYSVGYGPRTNFTYDGLHPSALGAYWIAKAKADVLNQLLPAYETLFANSDNVWNADNPTGNLVANGLLTGSVATSSNGATGNVPTSWTGTRGGSGQNMSVAFSKVANSSISGLDWAAMTLGGTSNADGSSTGVLRQDFSLTGTPVAAGDLVEAFADVEISGQSNVQGVQMLLRLISSGNYDVYDGSFGNGSSLVIPEGITVSGVMRTPRLVAPSGTITGARFDLSAIGGPNTNAVAGLVKFGRVLVKRVA